MMDAAASTGIASRRRSSWRSSMRLLVLPALLALLALTAVVAATIGAAGIPLGRLAAVLGVVDGDPAHIDQDWLVLWSIRLPRIALAVVIGGLLELAGAIMQGLFRNPLADPRSSGCRAAPPWRLHPDRRRGSLSGGGRRQVADRGVAAGGLRRRSGGDHDPLSHRDPRRAHLDCHVPARPAIAALANAGVGLLIFLADDRQLRDISFWMLGSLGGATWAKVVAIAPFLAVARLRCRSLRAASICWCSASPRRFTAGSRSSASSASRSCWWPRPLERRCRSRA